MTTPYYPTRWLITAADLSDDPDVFPFLLGQSFLGLKTPQWSTKIDTSVAGTERRRALWSYPIWRFQVGHEYLRSDLVALELQRLTAFFNSKFGSVQAFFYYDRDDNAVTANQFGTGDGTTTKFQVTRTTQMGDGALGEGADDELGGG